MPSQVFPLDSLGMYQTQPLIFRVFNLPVYSHFSHMPVSHRLPTSYAPITISFITASSLVHQEGGIVKHVHQRGRDPI